MKKYLLLYIFCFPLKVLAQEAGVYTPYAVPPIVIDKITKKSSSPLPFDKTFTLQYKLDTLESLFNVYAYKVRVVNGKRVIVDTNSIVPVVKIKIDGFDTIKGVLTIHVPALKPNTFMDIALVRKLSNAEIDSLLILNEELYGYSISLLATNLTITDSSYYRFIRNNLTQKPYLTDPGFAKYSFIEYKDFFFTKLFKTYKEIKNHNYVSYNSNSGTSKAPIYTQLPIITYDELKLVDKNLVDRKWADDDLIPLVTVINKMDKMSAIQNFMDGTADMTSKYPKASLTDTDDYETRIDNLTATIAYTNKLIALLEKSQLTFALPNDLYAKALLYRQGLSDNQKLLIADYNFIRATSKNDKSLNANDWLLTQNEFNDLSVLSKYVIMPDLGITTMIFQGNQKYRAFPRPFIGINIYFRPVDKSLDERDFPKGEYDIRRLLSLQVGLTYGKLDGQEFSNLFNDFNLMVGPSYRLVRWFRIGAGTALAQEINANPLISQTHTKFGGYVALSFDLDIFSSATQVTARVLK
jgi:hypothetical protein